MNVARYIEPGDRVKAAALAVEMGDWVHLLAPWQVISHLTFSWEASIWSAARCYEKFMRSELRGVSYFYALEQNPELLTWYDAKVSAFFGFGGASDSAHGELQAEC
jgi:hypothetical protein